MNTITIELCAEDRARLDKLLNLLENNITPTTLEVAKAPEPIPEPAPQPEPVKVEEPTPTPEPEIPEAPEEPTPEPVAEEPKKVGFAPTVDNLRKIALMLTSAGHKQEVRDIVNKYATKLSEVPEDKIAECMAELEKIGG